MKTLSIAIGITVLVLVGGAVLMCLIYLRLSSLDWASVSGSKWRQNYSSLLAATRSPGPTDRVAIICYENRSSPAITSFRKLNEKYARHHGYKFFFFREHHEDQSTGYPPYWIKIKLLFDALNTDQWDYVVWIDSDACLCNSAIGISALFTIFNPDACFLMIGDDVSTFNAGFFIIRSSEKGKEFCTEWLGKYPRANWKQNADGKWTCGGCRWAGSKYEQGAGTALLRKKKYAQYIIRCPIKFFQEQNPNHPQMFVVHYMGRRPLMPEGARQIEENQKNKFYQS